MSEYLKYISGKGFRLEKSESLEPKPLIANADIPSPDGEGANKGFWRHQLRDRKKQFAKMYGSVIFDSVMDGVKVSGHGTVVDILEGNVAVVEVKGHPTLPDGKYKIAGDQLEAAKGVIPSSVVKTPRAKKLDSAPKLKTEISGDEALRIFKSYGENYAKTQGRLPIIRSNEDVIGGAKIMYASIHDDFKLKYPELYEKMGVKNPEEFATKALSYGVNNTTRYLNDPKLVPQEQIAINKIVAEKIFGIDPENGLIEYYRNAVNHNSTKEKAAAGYASLDKNFAWDYGTYGSYPQENDGSYSIKVKPSEIQGLIGYSAIQDEYAVLIPAYITENNPDRITKVGPLQMRRAASYIDDSNIYNRSGGGTPFRHFSTASTFEFFPLDENPLPGESFDDFNEAYKDKNGGKILKISEWIDSRYGEGDFQDIKNKASDPEKFYNIKDPSGNIQGKKLGVIPKYKTLQDLFVKTEDGKYGIDPIELNRVRLSISNLAEKNDKYEVYLKILTAIQEISGKTFMVNRGHDKNDQRIPEKKKLENKSDLPVITEWYVDADGKRIPDANLTDTDKTPENKRVFDRVENTLVDGNGKDLEFTPTYDKKSSPLPEIAPDHNGFWDSNQVSPEEVVESHDVDEVVDTLKRGGFVTTDPKTAFAASTKVDQLAKDGKLIDFKDGALVGEDKELSKALKGEISKLPKQYQYRIQRAIDLDELTQDQGKELVQFLKDRDGKVSLEDLSEIHKNFRNLGIDITNMQVAGDKNFTQNSTGALRADMPQVTPENQPAFLDDLDRLGIGYKRTTTDVTKLTPVQAEMDMSKVGGMAKLFTTEEGWNILTKNGTDYMFVTSDGYVIDGHHRWAGAVVSAWETGKPVDLPVIELDIPYDRALTLINEWNDQHGVVRKKLRPERPKKPEAPKVEELKPNVEENQQKVSGTEIPFEVESNKNFKFDDGRLSLSPGDSSKFEVSDRLKSELGLDSIDLKYTGSAISDIIIDRLSKEKLEEIRKEYPNFVEESLGSNSYIFQLTNSPNESVLPNGYYQIDSNMPKNIKFDIKGSGNYFIGSELPKPRSKESQSALDNYTTLGYSAVNTYLRTGDSSLDKESPKTVEILDSYLNSQKFDKDTELYRGFVSSNPERIKFLEQLKPGDVFDDQGYMSASQLPGIAERYSDPNAPNMKGKTIGENGLGVILKIKAKKNSNGVSVFRMGDAVMDEREVLLPRSSKRSDQILITNVTKRPDGRLVIDAEYGPSKKEVEAPTVDNLGIDYQSATMDAGGERLPTPGAFTGKFQKIMEGAKDWKEVDDRLRKQTITYFDFETTGISDYDGDGIKNDPVQLGAVQVKDGKVLKRFNVYINPGSKLSEWSANNLKRDVEDENGQKVLDESGKPKSTLVTPEWLSKQISPDEGLKQFIEFMGPDALLGGQNVPFDLEILKRMANDAGINLDISGTVDSKDLASLLPKYDPEKGIDGPKRKDPKTGELVASSSLGPVANYLGFEPANWHSADGDAEDSFNLVQKIIDRAATENNQDLRQLDFPALEKQYKQKMDAFKAATGENNPITERQNSALNSFTESDNEEVSKLAKTALSGEPLTRGSAAKILEKIHQLTSKDQNKDTSTPKTKEEEKSEIKQAEVTPLKVPSITKSYIESKITPPKIDAYSPEWLEKAKAEYEENRNLMNGDSAAPTTFTPGDTLFSGFDGTYTKFIPNNPNEPTKGGHVERTSATNQKLINYNGRVTALVDINGVMVPFYLSSGSGGKKDVEAGKWYPFFGIGEEQDWYNKANSKYINNYYGSPELRAQAKWLDDTFGDVRNDRSIPGVGADYQNKFRELINKDVHAVDNKQDGEPGAENLDTLLKANIGDIVKRVRMGSKSGKKELKDTGPLVISEESPEEKLKKALDGFKDYVPRKEPSSDTEEIEDKTSNGVTHIFDGKEFYFSPEELKKARYYISKNYLGAQDVTDEEGKAFNEKMRALTDYIRKNNTTNETLPAQRERMGMAIPVKELRHSAPPERFDEIIKNGIRPKITDKVGAERYFDRRFGVFLANGYTSGEAGDNAEVFRVKVPESDLRVDSGYAPEGGNLYVERTISPDELEHLGHLDGTSFNNLHSGTYKDCPICNKSKTGWEPKEGATTGKGESKRLDDLITGDIIDLDSLNDDDAPISNFEKEDLPDDQYQALYSYSNGGFKDINTLLREDRAINDEKEAIARQHIKALDNLIDIYGTIDRKRTVYRGMVQYMQSENGEPTLQEKMESLEPGDIILEPGYTSTSSNKFISFSEFGPGSGNKGDVSTASGTIGTYGGVFMSIDIPENGRALAIPKRGFNHASAEEEVLLPRDTSIKIKAIRKVPQIDSDGEETGSFNYYVDAEVIPKEVEPPEVQSASNVIEITKELRDSLEALGGFKTTYSDKDIKKISDLAKELSTSTGIKFSPDYFKTQSTQYMPEVLDAVNIQSIDQPATSNIDKAFKPSLEAKETKDKLVAAGKQILDLAEKDAEVRFRKDYDVPENMELEEFFKVNSEDLLSTAIGDLETENERLANTWGEMFWLYGSGDQEAKNKAISEFKKDLEERYGDMDDVFGKGWVDKLINYADNPDKKEVEDDRFLLDEIYRWHLVTFPDVAKEIKNNKYYGSIDSITGVEEYKDRDGNTRYSGGMIRILSAYMLMDRPDIQEKYADIRRKIDQIETTSELGKGIAEDKKIYHQYLRDSYMDIMRKAGIEFDSVTIEDFGSELRFIKISNNGRDFIDDFDIENNKKLFEGAMKYVPKSIILSTLNAIRYGYRSNYYNGLSILNNDGPRGYYSENLKIISTHNSSDTLLHEFWHLLQYRNPNIKILEHAWMYDRLANDEGTLPDRFDIYGKENQKSIKEYGFAKPGIANPYTVKQYSTNEDSNYKDFEFVPYSPDGKGSATEVSTTLMQDLFTNPGEFSVGTGFTAVEGDDENRTLYSNAYQDPATGIWYTDKTMSTKLNPKYVYGRSEDDPYDKEFKAFGIGMLLALNELKDE